MKHWRAHLIALLIALLIILATSLFLEWVRLN
jgi:hypothetical protein